MFGCVFHVRPFWDELNVPKQKLESRYKELFGTENLTIEDRQQAIKLLLSVVTQLQNKILNRLKTNNPNATAKILYRILDDTYTLYTRERESRERLSTFPMADADMEIAYRKNANIERNIIDALNLWIENCLLYQEKIHASYDERSLKKRDDEFLIDLYIYGYASKSVSLLTFCKKFPERNFFYGIEVTPKGTEPFNILKENHVLHFNIALTGNQRAFNRSVSEYNNVDIDDFGKAFINEYGVSFKSFLGLLYIIMQKELKKGKISHIVWTRSDFIKWINGCLNCQISGESFLESFSLTKERISSQLLQGNSFIWIMNSNQYRHELRPFICLDDNTVFISYAAISQAFLLWNSYFVNGGMIYSNHPDTLTVAVGKRNELLSEILVSKIREKLRNHYNSEFDEVDVQYDRIFGRKDYNYGDYELVFYAKEVNELFLVEAKFFSDSLNNGGIVADYEKMFKTNGYYDHCRKRYDLVLSEPEKLKSFVGITGNVAVHFLFVSSKPLDVNFVDDDGIVTFPCLSNFDEYIEGKLLSETGDEVVRPTHLI